MRAVIALIALHLLALVAEPLAPYASDVQHRDFPYAPPSRLHLVDAGGRFHVVPFVYGLKPVAGRLDAYEEDRGSTFSLRLLAHRAPYRVAGIVPGDRRLVSVDAPGHLFLLGTDRYGRDVFSRLVLGARLSLFAGLAAAVLALGLAALVGTVAGFYRGRVDDTLMGMTNVFLALPWIYFLLAVRSVLPLDLPPAQAFLVIVTLIGVLGWARPARIVRSVVLSERSRDYVAAARSCGATDRRILIRHVLPSTAVVLFTQAAIMAPRYMLGEVTLSFLGLGLGEPTPSWGTLAAGAMPPDLVLRHWWLAAPFAVLIPVIALYELAANALVRANAEVRWSGSIRTVHNFQEVA